MNAAQWFNKHGVMIQQLADGWSWSRDAAGQHHGVKGFSSYADAEANARLYIENSAPELIVEGDDGRQVGALTGADLLKDRRWTSSEEVTAKSVLALCTKLLSECQKAAALAVSSASDAQAAAKLAQDHAERSQDGAAAAAGAAVKAEAAAKTSAEDAIRTENYKDAAAALCEKAQDSSAQAWVHARKSEEAAEKILAKES